MIWTALPDLDELNAFTKDTMVQHIGIEITGCTPDSITASMPVDHRTNQPYGVLHGGATATLAETVGSLASQMAISDPVNGKVVGVELNINHLRQVTSGKVHGTATAIKVGRRLHVWQIDIKDDSERQISSARLTVMVL